MAGELESAIRYGEGERIRGWAAQVRILAGLSANQDAHDRALAMAAEMDQEAGRLEEIEAQIKANMTEQGWRP